MCFGIVILQTFLIFAEAFAVFNARRAHLCNTIDNKTIYKYN